MHRSAWLILPLLAWGCRQTVIIGGRRPDAGLPLGGHSAGGASNTSGGDGGGDASSGGSGGGATQGGGTSGGAAGGSELGGGTGGGDPSAGGLTGGGSPSGGSGGGAISGGTAAGGGASGGTPSAGGAAGGSANGGGTSGGTFSGGASGGSTTAGGAAGGAEPFPTEFVVVLVGDGQSALSASATNVLLQRRTMASGALTSSLPLPATASGAHFPFSLAGTGSSEGSLTRSTDGRTLVLAGYGATPGTLTVQSSTAPRVVALIRAGQFSSGTVDTSTVLTGIFTGNSPRSAVLDGNNLWVAGGSGGIFRTTSGSTSMPINVLAAPTSNRVLGILGGQLFVATGTTPAGIYQVGNGLPLVSTTSTSVVGVSNPYGFSAFDVSAAEPGIDVLYVADEMQGLLRFVKSGGTWSLSATFTPATRHLACANNRGEAVCIASSSSGLFRLQDSNFALPSGALTPIGTAATNTSFRGVAFFPLP